jgi:hypothetical protein
MIKTLGVPGTSTTRARLSKNIVRLLSVKTAAQVIQKYPTDSIRALNELNASAEINLIPKALWALNRDQKFDVVSESSRGLLLNSSLSQEGKVEGLHAAVVAFGRSKKPTKVKTTFLL